MTYAEAHGTDVKLAPGGDPLEVVRQGSIQQLPHVGDLEAMLTDLELAAVEVAAPTPNAEQAISALRGAGHRLAVVSNNSTAALKRYFAIHGLESQVWPLIGREATRLRLMKPDPYMLRLALSEHQVEADQSALVGDSVTDIQAARAAGSMVIGYANKPGKAERLSEAGATVVIEDMADLIRAAR